MRRDPLTGRLVAVAPARAKRPGAGRGAVEPPTDEELASCPFCEGREDRTPPEALALGRDGAADTPGWQVRVVPNLYPAFERHEVVVHGPVHVRSLAELDDSLLDLVAEAWRLRARTGRGYVHALVNEGREAGASLAHSHSQLVWLPEEPAAVAAEQGEECRLCALLDREREDGVRVVVDENGLVAVCPWASRVPYELLIAPVDHEADGFESALLGRALRLAADVVRRLRTVEGPRPLNLWLHGGDHWHIEVLPRLTILAGLELGAGVYVNALPPEDGAAVLRRGSL